MSIIGRVSRFFQKKSVKFSIPFLLLVVGGPFGLQYFTENRYRYRKTNFVTPEVAEQYGVHMRGKKEVTLDSEFEKIKEVDIQNWENKRGPRPWESS